MVKGNKKSMFTKKSGPILREINTAYNPLAGIAEQYTLQSITPLFLAAQCLAIIGVWFTKLNFLSLFITLLELFDILAVYRTRVTNETA